MKQHRMNRRQMKWVVKTFRRLVQHYEMTHDEVPECMTWFMSGLERTYAKVKRGKKASLDEELGLPSSGDARIEMLQKVLREWGTGMPDLLH